MVHTACLPAVLREPSAKARRLVPGDGVQPGKRVIGREHAADRTSSSGSFGPICPDTSHSNVYAIHVWPAYRVSTSNSEMRGPFHREAGFFPHFSGNCLERCFPGLHLHLPARKQPRRLLILRPLLFDEEKSLDLTHTKMRRTTAQSTTGRARRLPHLDIVAPKG